MGVHYLSNTKGYARPRLSVGQRVLVRDFSESTSPLSRRSGFAVLRTCLVVRCDVHDFDINSTSKFCRYVIFLANNNEMTGPLRKERE
jgi:hypothetical protein